MHFTSGVFIVAAVSAVVVSFSLRAECAIARRRDVTVTTAAGTEESSATPTQPQHVSGTRLRDRFPGRVRVNPLEAMLARAQDFSPVKIENDKGMIKVQFRRVLPKVAAYMGQAVHRFQTNLSDFFAKTVYG